MFRSLSYRCQPMTKHKNVTNGNLKKVKVKLCWLLISSISPPLLPSGLPATSSSASHCDPALLLPLLHLKTTGGHHPHNWCLVKFRFRIHNNISLAWSDPNCLVDLPFEAAVKTSSHNHWEDLLLTTVYQLMWPDKNLQQISMFRWQNILWVFLIRMKTGEYWEDCCWRIWHLTLVRGWGNSLGREGCAPLFERPATDVNFIRVIKFYTQRCVNLSQKLSRNKTA